jgi:hypothetical protein
MRAICPSIAPFLIKSPEHIRRRVQIVTFLIIQYFSSLVLLGLAYIEIPPQPFGSNTWSTLSVLKVSVQFDSLIIY